MALPYANLDTLHALKAEREIAELQRQIAELKGVVEVVVEVEMDRSSPPPADETVEGQGA